MKLQREQQPEEGKPQPRPAPPRARAAAQIAGLGLLRAEARFANFYFNKLERDRLLGGFHQHGDFAGLAG